MGRNPTWNDLATGRLGNPMAMSLNHTLTPGPAGLGLDGQSRLINKVRKTESKVWLLLMLGLITLQPVGLPSIGLRRDWKCETAKYFEVMFGASIEFYGAYFHD